MAVGFGVAELIALIFFGGGVGLPMGIPPGPEDPVLAKLAPEKCLVCLMWNGTVAPDPKSSNQTEQLLAEPELQKLGAGILRAIARKMPPGVDALLWFKTLFTRPAILYLRSIDVRAAAESGGPPREVHAGLIVNTGDRTAAIRESLERLQKLLPEQMVKPIQLDGDTWYRLDDGRMPPVTWGTKDDYTGIAIGQGEGEAILKRSEGEPPRWLTAALERLPVARRASLLYANHIYARETLVPLAPPGSDRVLHALGLDGLISVAMVSGLDDEGFVGRMHIGLDGPPRGVLKLLAGKPLTAKDLAPIPADSQVALALRADAGQVFDTILALIGEIDPAQGQQAAAGRAEVDRRLGVDLRNDVLGTLGDVWLAYSSPGEGVMFPFGLTAVAAVRDAVRLRQAQEKLVAAALQAMPKDGPNRGQLERSQVDGQTVFYFQPGQPIPVTPAWTVADHYLVGSLTMQNVKGFLLRKPGGKSLADVPAVAALFRANPGPVAIGYQDTGSLFRAFYPAIQLFAAPLGQKLREAGIDFDLGLLPTTSTVAQHLRPSITTVRQASDGFEIDSRGTIPGANISSVSPVAVGLLLPAVNSARNAARRTASMNNVKQLLLAMHAYEATNRSLPPAFTVDKEGKPLLSWRVAILPFVEELDLYRQFHLNEPWDSPHNKSLIGKMPKLFLSPRSAAGPGKTCYLTVRGNDTVFPGAKPVELAAIRDGMSNTVIVVEVNDASAVPWTKPDDFEPDPQQPTKGLEKTWPGTILAGFADGSVRQIALKIDPQALKAFFTRAGGEVVERP